MIMDEVVQTDQYIVAFLTAPLQYIVADSKSLRRFTMHDTLYRQFELWKGFDTDQQIYLAARFQSEAKLPSRLKWSKFKL